MLNVLEIMCLRTICIVRRGDQVRNDRVRERYGNKKGMAEKGVLK